MIIWKQIFYHFSYSHTQALIIFSAPFIESYIIIEDQMACWKISKKMDPKYILKCHYLAPAECPLPEGVVF